MENIKRIDDKRVEIDGQVYRLDEPCENKAEEKRGNRFTPNIGETYYCIDWDGSYDYFEWSNGEVDNKAWVIGNCFKTKEDAEFVAEKLKVLAELSEFTEPKDRPWDEKTGHWFFCWNITNKRMEYVYNDICKSVRLYFESEEIAQQAIATVGEDRIKKYLFGVNE